MCLIANLPEKLQLESFIAAIYLYNQSLSYINYQRILNKVLNLQFRNYFRQYNPELIARIIVNLRPNQNGIYIYSSRAYLIIKDREVGRNKRVFKIISRGHIGYLVKYVTSNIYKIWVPVLNKVIIIRNIIFNENIFYKKNHKHTKGHSIEITKDIVELLLENEIQDTKSIFENKKLWYNSSLEQTENEPELGGNKQMNQ